jgi:iron-sulfur cluster assembly protein
MQKSFFQAIKSKLFGGSSTGSDDSSSESSIHDLPTTMKQTLGMSVVTVTDAAKTKLLEFLAGQPQSYIRVSIKKVGAMAFQHSLQMDSAKLGSMDIPDRKNGFLLVTDAESSVYLNGTVIDWQTTPEGGVGFVFNNPNAIEQTQSLSENQ